MKWLLFLLLFPLFANAQDPIAIGCDILIINGKIIDGTGNSWYYGNIAVKDGKILKMGSGVNLSAKKTIDAKGLIVAPGFIDVHTHLEDKRSECHEFYIRWRYNLCNG
jgi:N-acyl-D-amino-acid deacylase